MNHSDRPCLQTPRTCLRLVLPGMLCAWLGAAPALAQNYVRTEIEREPDGGALVLEDLDGDGRLDLVIPRWQRNLGRELLVYHQLEDGRFDTTPDPVEIKTEIIAVGFADLRPEPGKELVLYANNGVFSLSSNLAGYTGNLRPLLQWKLIADVPDPYRVQFIRELADLDGDGQTDLLIPGQDHYGYFRGSAGESFTLANEFSTINRALDPAARPRGDADLSASLDINSRDGIKLQVRATQPSPFAGFIQQWDAAEDAQENLLEAENFMPPAQLADFNGDGRKDIIFINVGLDLRGQVNLLLQDGQGNFPALPDWQGPIDTRGDIRMADLDGDRLTDMVRLSGEGNEWDAYLYRNRGSLFDFDQPDQVMKFSGYDVELEFMDIDRDGKPELSVSYYTIPVVEAIRNTSIVRTQLLYAAEGGGQLELFGRRPRFRLDESFSASNVRGLAEQMSLRFDVDGDGFLDALYITDAGTLAAKRITPDLRIEEQPFWEYVPGRSVLGFSVQDLNQDARPDLVLRHGSSVSLLVAAP